MKNTLIIIVLLLVTTIPALSSASTIDRVEPPFWWTGFRETHLQLLVYGEGISELEPSLSHPGVTLERVETVDSPNYLFLYLDIAADASPGSFDILFEGEGEELSHSYTLKAKNPDPAWTKGFDSSDAIYLITPDRFANGDPENDDIEGMGDPVDRENINGRHGGDIRGIAQHLDYVADMGFTAIWLNPLLENRMPEFSYHGYSTTDFYRVDPRYGSNEDYKDMVAQAREQGLGVIMDMIVNHVGSGHWWMDDLPTGDWLNFQGAPRMMSHEHIAEQDPHASQWDYRRYSDGWFVESMPDLNQRNQLLADYLTQNALWWIEYLGLAGIRMDTYPYPDKHYMSEWTRRVMLEYPDFNVVGEEWTDNSPALAYWQRGKVNTDGYVSHLPSLMDFPLQNALRWGLVTEEDSKTEDLRPGGLLMLYRALANDFVYPSPGDLVVFPDNHDMSRIFTQLGGDYGLFRMAIAYTLVVRGVPQIYYGTEILMANHEADDHGLIRSDFPGGWPGDEVNAATGKGLSESQLEAQQFLRTLLRWRRDTPVVHHGKLMHFRPGNGIYVLFRYDEQDAVMLVLNKNENEVVLGLERFQERLDGFRSGRNVISGESGSLGDTLRLPARSPLILELE